MKKLSPNTMVEVQLRKTMSYAKYLKIREVAYSKGWSSNAFEKGLLTPIND